MREALFESYFHEDARAIASLALKEAIDMSVEEPDHASWNLMGASPGEPTVGGIYSKEQFVEDAKVTRGIAYRLFYSSPFVRGIIRTLGKFIFGKGVTIELAEKDKTKKKQADEYIKAWQDQNGWDLIQRESSNRSFRDGECFWYLRKVGKSKIPRLEFIEPDEVRSSDKKATYGIELDPKDATRVIRYHIKKELHDTGGTFIRGEDMVHIKLNVDRNVKRGRTLFEPVFKYLKMHDDWLNSRVILNKVRSAVALVRHIEGSQVQGQLIRNQTQDKKTVGRRNSNKVQAFKPGTILTAGPGVKYEMLSANLGASDAANDGRNILLCIAVGIGFPEMFLTGDFSNANYSSSMVAQNPFVREFEDWQDFFDFYMRDLFKKVLERGMEVGLVAKGTSTDVTIKFPPLTYEDFVAMTTALGQLYMNEVISLHTYAAKSGFDYEEEKKLREKEMAAADPDDSGFGDPDADPSAGDESGADLEA